MNKIVYILVLISFMQTTVAQNKTSIELEQKSFSLIFGSYAFQMPGGDLSDRFGNNSNIGAGFLRKTNKNWLYGASGEFLFGNSVKNYFSILQNLSTSDGRIIGKNGLYADANLFERGYLFSAKFGKLIPVFKKNENSGVLFLFSMGFLQHKILVKVADKTIPALEGEYIKGYDKMSNGLVICQFLGYMHFGKKYNINYFAGVEFSEAWTSCRRAYNFDEMKKDDETRFDLLSSLRVGWIFPLYGKNKTKEYYYD